MATIAPAAIATTTTVMGVPSITMVMDHLSLSPPSPSSPIMDTPDYVTGESKRTLDDNTNTNGSNNGNGATVTIMHANPGSGIHDMGPPMPRQPVASKPEKPTGGGGGYSNGMLSTLLASNTTVPPPIHMISAPKHQSGTTSSNLSSGLSGKTTGSMMSNGNGMAAPPPIISHHDHDDEAIPIDTTPSPAPSPLVHALLNGTTDSAALDAAMDAAIEQSLQDDDAFASNQEDGTDGETWTKSNLIVKYLPLNTTQETLHVLFAPYGNIISCKLIRDRNTGFSLGYGFVKYDSEASAAVAVAALNEYKLDNKTIRVVVARPVSQQHKESIKSNIYIAGLPKHYSKTIMDDYFGLFGRIVESRVLIDHAGISRGIGFVRYEDASQAAKAIQHTNGLVAPGGLEPLVVKYARDSSSRGWPGGVVPPSSSTDVPPPVLFTSPPAAAATSITLTLPPPATAPTTSSAIASSSSSATAAIAAAQAASSSSHLSVPRPTASPAFTSLPSYPPLSPASHYGAGQASPDEYYRHLHYYQSYQNMYANAYSGHPYSPVSPAYSAATAAAAAAELALATPPGSAPQSPAPMQHSPLGNAGPMALPHHHHLAAAHAAAVAANIASPTTAGGTPGGSPLMHPHHTLNDMVLGLTPPQSPLQPLVTRVTPAQPTQVMISGYNPLASPLSAHQMGNMTMAHVHAAASHAHAQAAAASVLPLTNNVSQLQQIQALQQQQSQAAATQALIQQQQQQAAAQYNAAVNNIQLTPQNLAAIQLLPTPTPTAGVLPSGVNISQLGTAGPERPGFCLFVFHLPQEVKEEELLLLFARCGSVLSVKIISDPHTGLSKGYGFVNMATHPEAQNAIYTLNGTRLGTKYIKVSFKKKK